MLLWAVLAGVLLLLLTLLPGVEAQRAKNRHSDEFAQSHFLNELSPRGADTDAVMFWRPQKVGTVVASPALGSVTSAWLLQQSVPKKEGALSYSTRKRSPGNTPLAANMKRAH